MNFTRQLVLKNVIKTSKTIEDLGLKLDNLGIDDSELFEYLTDLVEPVSEPILSVVANG